MEIMSQREFDRNGATVKEAILKDVGEDAVYYKLVWAMLKPNKPAKELPGYVEEQKLWPTTKDPIFVMEGSAPLPLIHIDFKGNESDYELALEKAREKVASKFDEYYRIFD